MSAKKHGQISSQIHGNLCVKQEDLIILQHERASTRQIAITQVKRAQ